jgi:hypothetical protein
MVLASELLLQPLAPQLLAQPLPLIEGDESPFVKQSPVAGRVRKPLSGDTGIFLSPLS